MIVRNNSYECILISEKRAYVNRIILKAKLDYGLETVNVSYARCIEMVVEYKAHLMSTQIHVHLCSNKHAMEGRS